MFVRKDVGVLFAHYCTGENVWFKIFRHRGSLRLCSSPPRLNKDHLGDWLTSDPTVHISHLKSAGDFIVHREFSPLT